MALTYFQVSLPSLSPTDFAAHPLPLTRALSGIMKVPEDERARQELFSQATAGALAAMREGSLSEDAVAALWTLIHHALPYRFEEDTDRAVNLSEEDVEMVQQLDRQWLEDIRAEGEARGRVEGEVEGLREALHAVVRVRFGHVPPELAQRISTVDHAALDALIVRAATATSLAAL